MKKTIMAGALASVLLMLSACGVQDSRDDEMILEGMMPKEDNKMIEDAMMKRGQSNGSDTMMQKEATGTYADYSAEALSMALASGKKVVLFFHAPWCPTCKAADDVFSKENPPSDMVVFKVDFDSSVELRKKYGVTYQHTFVSLNADTTLKEKSSGEKSYAQLEELF